MRPNPDLSTMTAEEMDAQVRIPVWPMPTPRGFARVFGLNVLDGDTANQPDLQPGDELAAALDMDALPGEWAWAAVEGVGIFVGRLQIEDGQRYLVRSSAPRVCLPPDRPCLLVVAVTRQTLLVAAAQASTSKRCGPRCRQLCGEAVPC